MIGQFDTVILLNQGYPEGEEPELKDVNYVVNFDLPPSYNQYKATGSTITNPEGAIINLVNTDKDSAALTSVQKKMQKAFGRQDCLKCLPIIWHEMVKMKGRVEEVLSNLSNKRVRDEKLLEFKKQVVSNKSLKEYFKHNPTEKVVLQNDIQKHSFHDKILFKNLDTLPFYAVPKEFMATTPE